MERRQFLLVLATVSCSKKQFTCTDVTGLTPDDIQARTTLAYSDFSTDVKKTCATCQQFVEANKEGCGTCKILKGPVHPNGSCKSFALKA